MVQQTCLFSCRVDLALKTKFPSYLVLGSSENIAYQNRFVIVSPTLKYGVEKPKLITCSLNAHAGGTPNIPYTALLIEAVTRRLDISNWSLSSCQPHGHLTTNCCDCPSLPTETFKWLSSLHAHLNAGIILVVTV